VNQLAVADAFAGGDRFAILQHDRFFGTFEMLGRKLDSLPGAHRRPQVRPLCP